MSRVPASARGLLRDDPDRMPAEPGERADDVLRPELLHLEQLAVVDHLLDDRPHVVRLGGLVRDERVELCVLAPNRVGRLEPGRRVDVVLRKEGEEVPRVFEARLLVIRGEVCDARLGRVRGGPAELLEADVLTGHRLHDLWPRDEHVRALLDHEDEVGHRRRVDGSAGRRAHDETDLRHDARGLNVAPEDLRVAAERDHAFLDPRAARVVDADHRAAELEREVHHLADLFGEGLREGAPEDREVLREDEDPPAEDRSAARDDGVPPRAPVHHPEVRGAVADVAVELDEAARVEQLFDALAGEKLAPRALALDGALVA